MTRFVLVAVAALTAATASAAEYPFTVTVTGKGRPVVFVPGFGCSGKVWDSTVAHLKDRCECHVLTLAGRLTMPERDQGPRRPIERRQMIALQPARRRRRTVRFTA